MYCENFFNTKVESWKYINLTTYPKFKRELKLRNYEKLVESSHHVTKNWEILNIICMWEKNENFLVLKKFITYIKSKKLSLNQ